MSVFFSCADRNPPLEPQPAESEGDAMKTTEPGESTSKSDPEKKPNMKTTVRLNSQTEGVKPLGVRALESSSQLNADWTCSGLEFVYDQKGGDLVFRVSASHPCYFRVYVDEAAWSENGNPYYRINGTQDMTIKDIPEGVHTVRVVKATGHTLARAHFYSMSFYGTLLKEQKPEDRELYIEFIGDSISCGWGVIGERKGAYSDQDGTLAYPYLVAQAMNADYSVTALSGQGLLMGEPGMTKGYLYSSPLRDSTAKYSFARKADIVVINIGTNDYAYRSQYGITEEALKEAYLRFVQAVIQKNGEDCKIYCLYNTMNDTFANAILEACRQLGGEEAGIFTLRMDRSYGNEHPSIAEHQVYAQKLVSYLKEKQNF